MIGDARLRHLPITFKTSFIHQLQTTFQQYHISLIHRSHHTLVFVHFLIVYHACFPEGHVSLVSGLYFCMHWNKMRPQFIFWYFLVTLHKETTRELQGNIHPEREFLFWALKRIFLYSIKNLLLYLYGDFMYIPYQQALVIF